MGDDATPLILAELDRHADHWFWALHSISGADPVPEECQGDIFDLANAWIEWDYGRENGCISKAVTSEIESRSL